MTGCQGELGNEEFNVHVEDMDGNVILDKKMKSQANGFIDLWLPRDQKYKTKVEHTDKVVEGELSTFEGDNTCITTMQLM